MMADTLLYPTPIIGSIGVYEFAPPLDTTPTELLECTGIRTISDYIANNEDVKEIAYTANGLTDSDYEADAGVNMEIVTFRNDGGYVYHIPTRFIAKFPIQDGILYRTMAFVVHVPGMKVTKDFSTLKTALSDTVKRQLGVTPTIEEVETKDPVPVEASQSTTVETARQMVIDENVDIYAKYSQVLDENERLRTRIAFLEQYIIDNKP